MARAKTVLLADLIRDPKNARKRPEKASNALRYSMREFGAARSAVMDGDGVIRAGNGTIEAAIAEGMTKARIVKAKSDELVVVQRDDLTGPRATAYAIADNRTAELAEWDLETLEVDLDELKGEFDLDDLGFDEADLESLFDAASEPEEIEDIEPQTDRAEELKAKWGTEKGQLWIIKGKQTHRLLCGDSTKAEDVERLMGGEKADLVFTSPPYNSGNGGYKTDYSGKTKKFYHHDKDDRTEDEWVEFCDKVLSLCSQSIEDDTPVLWNVAYTAQCRSGYGRSMFAGGHDLTVKETICWDKGNGFPSASKGILSRNWELIFVLSRGGKYRTTQGDNEPRWNKWDIRRPKEQHELHKATYPIELVDRAFKDFGGSLAYEPFTGSGTTMLAAEQLNRKCYGMEISDKYCAVILERMTDAGCSCELQK